MTMMTGNTGLYYCGQAASKNGWIFRNQPELDVGIDAHMEKTNEDGSERQLLALQIKSGKSYFQEKSGECYVYRGINERQYNYWTTNSLPCIIVLYNPENDFCIWEKLTVETIQKAQNGNGSSYVIKVPENQVFLDELSNAKLLDYTNLPRHITNYNFLLSQKYFMEVIKNGGTVKLHSEEWLNKSSGRGKTELIVDSGNGEEHYQFPYYFPFMPYEHVFPKLFPWANFSIDAEFYEENDEDLWHLNECIYDKDTDEWFNFGLSFSEYRETLGNIRYIDHVGEVGEYMLVLSLNNLGVSFLQIDQYISQRQFYIDVRPK